MTVRKVVLTGLCLVLFAVPCGAAEKKAGKPSLPDGLKGFSGQLQGSVVAVREDGRGFCLKVKKVGKVWKNNKAKNPKAAVGRRLRILAQWTKGEDGRWHPFRRHVGFIKSLKPREAVTIEVHNDEGDRLHILELSEEQRERAD